MKKQTRKKKVPPVLYYLNYKHLQHDMQLYGFELSPVRLFFFYFLTVAVCILVCIPFKLPFLSMLAISVTGILCMPLVLVSSQKQKAEETRYMETSMYISSMLSAFSIKPKILEALKSTKNVISSIPMSSAINEAIEHILYTSYSSGDVREEALRCIEQKYNCKRISTLHRFLINVETKGGEYDKTLELLQKDRELWENRVEEFLKDEKAKRIEATISAVFVIFLCWALTLLGNMTKTDITVMPAYQVCTTLMIVAEMVLFIKINCPLDIDLLKRISLRSEKAMIEDYETVMNYNREEDNVKSIQRAIIPAIIIVVGLVLRKIPVVVIGAVILFYVVCDKRVGYAMSVKQLKKELSYIFPQWLMEMALLLQTNNVRNSIRLTAENAHPVLKGALEKMITELDENPTSMEPYMNFLGPLRTKAISSSMMLLYAAASGTNGNPEERIKEIINSTIKMTDKAEKMENEDKLLSLDLLFKAPVIPGTIAILVYAVLILMSALDMSVYL